ncbi:hypothetical protein J4E83_009376 [Alternaria metachromatica]|uniref:uncharacterized protein n=1 Tax=Alternaria metachromatica TaxID=283354 RepID=UPI0020C29DD5|nr:uncharacterized protein J4E83_009376 [Alternaria metachromatica]KAI4607833.1 hypothetical protein J4E83_009376 [Alternaria metachromatica]
MANQSPKPDSKGESSELDPATTLVNDASTPILSSGLNAQPEHESREAVKRDKSADQGSLETEPRAQEAHPRTTNPALSARDLARVATSNPDQRDGEEALRADDGARTRTDAVTISLATLKTLLGHIFEGKSARLPQPQLVCADRGQMALSKRLGCDFTLVVDEVAFDVNSGFLIAGSEVLEGYAFPGGGTLNTLTRECEFNAQVHSPTMVDRLVEFIYTGTYKLDKGGRATMLHHATKLPIGKTKASYPMKLEAAAEFHLEMYKMGRDLRYHSLVAVAHSKMAEDMLWKSTVDVGIAKSLVNWIYGSAQRLHDTAEETNDTLGDDNLKELVVACILRHVHQKLWDGEEVEGFKQHVQAYPALEVDWELAEEEYKELLRKRPEAKRGAKRARREEQHQQEVASMLQLLEGPTLL